MLNSGWVRLYWGKISSNFLVFTFSWAKKIKKIEITYVHLNPESRRGLLCFTFLCGLKTFPSEVHKCFSLFQEKFMVSSKASEARSRMPLIVSRMQYLVHRYKHCHLLLLFSFHVLGSSSIWTSRILIIEYLLLFIYINLSAH